MLRTIHHVAPLAVLGLGTLALAQEPINTTAATQPGVGRLVIREQFRWLESNEGFEPGAGDTTEFQSWTSVFYGLRHDFALGAELPVRALDISPGDDDLDHGSARFLAKWRFHRADLEALDTERASLIAGVRAETDEELSLTPGFASDSNDPILGAVYTTVRGRRGFNGALVGTFASDGDPDEIRYDAAGLYRMSPEVFAADTEAGWYLAVELNGLYESNGDNEVMFSPGFMYEARRWTGELSLQLPFLSEVDHRPEVDWTLVLGFRILL